jgi:hypothetical protein
MNEAGHYIPLFNFVIQMKLATVSPPSIRAPPMHSYALAATDVKHVSIRLPPAYAQLSLFFTANTHNALNLRCSTHQVQPNQAYLQYYTQQSRWCYHQAMKLAAIDCVSTGMQHAAPLQPGMRHAACGPLAGLAALTDRATISCAM